MAFYSCALAITAQAMRANLLAKATITLHVDFLVGCYFIMRVEQANLKNIFCQINTNYAIVVHGGHLTLIEVTRKKMRSCIILTVVG